MGVELRKSIGRKLEVVAEAAGLAASASGTAAALVFGKVLLAVALGAIAVGLFLRLASRRANHAGRAALSVPGWASGLAALLSVIEAAVLVEATDLPVRFSQPGFALHHWALVGAFLVVAYFAQRRVLGRLSRRHALPPAL
jgi:predicted dinucleotide-utilizing enzyme